uniref:Uncharacterized protein n=1 Tax=Timema tahoe TaxID=61484 RepID=A0A7R9IMK9_9NEOP|nr:unnamed protein product [Timema tahoe]
MKADWRSVGVQATWPVGRLSAGAIIHEDMFGELISYPRLYLPRNQGVDYRERPGVITSVVPDRLEPAMSTPGRNVRSVARCRGGSAGIAREMNECVIQTCRGEKQFWTGSRYGRSNQHLVEVAPRNDRFFLGSRYGKRADSTLLTRGEESSSSGSDIMTGAVEDVSPVTCMYTGITNLYRCFNRKDNTSEDSSVLSAHN